MKKTITLIIAIIATLFVVKSQTQHLGTEIFTTDISKEFTFTTLEGDVFTFSFYCSPGGSTSAFLSSTGSQENWYGIDCIFYTNDYPTGVIPQMYITTDLGNQYIFNGSSDYWIGYYSDSFIEIQPNQDVTCKLRLSKGDGSQVYCEFYYDVVALENSNYSASWGVINYY